MIGVSRSREVAGDRDGGDGGDFIGVGGARDARRTTMINLFSEERGRGQWLDDTAFFLRLEKNRWR